MGDYDVLVEMDTDGSHDPGQLPQPLAALGGPDGGDLVLGSRWVAGGRVVSWPRRREILSRGGNLCIRLVLGIPLHDATGGCRASRRAVLEGIDFATVASEGCCFQVDLAWRTLRVRSRLVEVPIVFTEHEQDPAHLRPGRRALLARGELHLGRLGGQRGGHPSPARTAAAR